ncbi:MAG: hypothetical protein ACK4TB_01990 [Gemmobacter sp.]
MPIYILKGNQVGEALQFVENGQTTRVEIGRVWFAETDTVRIVTTPGSVDANGTFFGGNGAVTAFSVTTAAGLTTTFYASPDGLDVDRDLTKQGPDFAYISEKPGSGQGGAYAGLNIEKIMISDVPLTAYSVLTYANGGGWVPGAGSVTPPVVTPPGRHAPCGRRDQRDRRERCADRHEPRRPDRRARRQRPDQRARRQQYR